MTSPPAPHSNSAKQSGAHHEEPHRRVGSLFRNWRANVGIVGAVIAAIWALIQYQEHEKENRISIALQYQRDLRSSPLFDSWRSVMIDNLEDANNQMRVLGTGKNDFFKYSMSLGARDKNNLDIIVAFYNNIWACTESHICDADVSAELYGPDASNLYTFYGVYLACEEGANADGIVNIRQAYWRLRGKKAPPFQPDRNECDAAEAALGGAVPVATPATTHPQS